MEEDKNPITQRLLYFCPDIFDLVVHGDTVEAVEKFVYLGAKTPRSCRSSPEIGRRIEMTHQAMKDLDILIWRSKLTFATKIRL